MFEVKLISSLLGNGESWIGLTKEHICIYPVLHSPGTEAHVAMHTTYRPEMPGTFDPKNELYRYFNTLSVYIKGVVVLRMF